MLWSPATSSAGPRLRLRLRLPLFFHQRALLATKAPPTPFVGIFWDLRSKPSSALLDAALRLRLLSSLFGPLRLSLAFSLRDLPTSPQHSSHPLPCTLCGRRFPDQPALLRHFHLLHRREHAKRLRRLDSAIGSRRENLAASMAAKLEKYRWAARGLSPVGPPPDDLREAGMRVVIVPDARVLGNRVVEAVEAGAVGCVVLASEDPAFEGAAREARARGARVVVVGDGRGGVLRRCADAGFSWREVAGGEARGAVETTLRRWRDGEPLGSLEWSYQPGEDGGEGCASEDVVLEEEKRDEGVAGAGLSSALGRVGHGAWWELGSD